MSGEYHMELLLAQMATNYAGITVANGFRTNMAADRIFTYVKFLEEFDKADLPVIMVTFGEVSEFRRGGNSSQGLVIRAEGKLITFAVTEDEANPSAAAAKLAWDVGRMQRDNPHVGNHPAGGFLAHSVNVEKIETLEGAYHPREMSRIESTVIWEYRHKAP